MKDVFPEPIQNLPQADIPLHGLTAFISQSDDHQILFMQFEEDVDLPEHAHAEQVGFVLEGKIDLVIDGSTTPFPKGIGIIFQRGLSTQEKFTLVMPILPFSMSQAGILRR